MFLFFGDYLCALRAHRKVKPFCVLLEHTIFLLVTFYMTFRCIIAPVSVWCRRRLSFARAFG